MLFYVALAWEASDPRQCANVRAWLQEFQQHTPPGWKLVLDTPGLVVSCYVVPGYTDLYTVYTLQNQAGVVLGKLFYTCEDKQSPVPSTLDAVSSREIVDSDGHALVKKYWGQYVAFLRDESSHTKWVLRDPTGEMDCYMTDTQGIDIYFRRLEDCQRLGDFSFTISRRGLLARTMSTGITTPLTCLAEVTALLAGECVQHRDGQRSQSFYWNPLRVALTDVIEDVNEAEWQLRQTLRRCTHAWASCFQEIVLRLSGGLDSAIVLSCLKDAPNKPRVVCENRVGRIGSQQDERCYARAIAEHIGFELTERSWSSECEFEIPSDLPRTPEPYYLGDRATSLWRMARLTSGTLAPVHFTGHGGDEVLFSHGYLPTLVDYLYRHGLNPRALGVAMEDAQADEVALWRILRGGITHGWLKRPWSFANCFRQVMRQPGMIDTMVSGHIWQEALEESVYIHPLYRDTPADVPPGKVFHCVLMSLAGDLRAFAPPADPPLMVIDVDPIRSQPVIELCLRIPLYILRVGGLDRALARRAFAAHLPQQTLMRRSKGGGNDALYRALAQKVEAVRDYLTNGQLVEQGYLDRERVIDALSRTSPTKTQVQPTLVRKHIWNEAWLANWARSGVRTVVA